MIRTRLQLIILFAVITGGLLFAISAKAASYWVTNPSTCPSSDPVFFPGQNCVPDNICGDSSGIAQCYSTAGISAPSASTTSNVQYSASHPSGGYLLNCYATQDSSAPFCDNNGAMWCNRNETCYGTNHKVTECTGGVFGSALCGTDCVSGYQDCDATPTVCEVQTGVTSCSAGANNNIGASCTCQCDSGYVDCDSSGPGAGTGCETTIGGSCSIGGLNGVWNASCTCVVSPQNFVTGVEAQFATNSPFLWGTQYGGGDLINISQNDLTTSTFLVSNSGQVGIGLTSVHAAAALEVSSTSRGVLFTRLTTTQRDGIATPPEGLLIYNIDNNQFEYYATSSWLAMGAGGAITYSADGEGLELSGTVFSIELDGSTLFKSASGLRLSTTTVSAGTYGSSTEMVVFTVDAYGRLTAVSTTTLSFSSSDLIDSSTIAYLNQDQTFTGQNIFANTTTFNSTTVFNDQVLVNTTTATSSLNLKVAGKIGANYYCDVNGENCFDPSAGLVTLISDVTSTPVSTFSGNFSTGTLKGYQAANDICNYYFSDYHFCFSGEIITFVRTHSIAKFADLPQSWIAEGPPGYTAYSNDCNGYTTSSMTYLGALWDYDSDGGGQGWLTGCNNTRAISCCK